MATEKDNTCPICQITWKDVASALPCRHQFCLGCILRWAQRNRTCPLCRRMIETVRFSEQGELDYVQLVITCPEGSAEAHSQAGRTPGHLEENNAHSPVVSPPSSPQGTLSPDEQGSSGPKFVGDLLPRVWAELFCQQQHLLDPVRPWLRQRLEGIYWNRWWLVEATESCILNCLCTYGPDAEVLAQRLVFLEEHKALLVQGLINVIADHCSEEAQRLLHSQSAVVENDSPSVSTSSSSFTSSRSQDGTPASHSAGSHMEEEADILETASHRASSCPQPEPVPAELDQPQEEPEQAAVVGHCSGQQPQPLHSWSRQGLLTCSNPVCPEEEHLQPAGPSQAQQEAMTETDLTPAALRDPHHHFI